MNHLLKTELLAVSAQNNLTYSILVSRGLKYDHRILKYSEMNNAFGVTGTGYSSKSFINNSSDKT